MNWFKFALLSLGICIVGWTAAQTILPDPPTVNAKSYILMEVETKTIITEFNSNEQLQPASLTKIMTSYVVASELASGRMKPDEIVNISSAAQRAPGSKMFLEEGDQVPISDLLRGVIIQSGNDASVAVAEHLSGDEAEFAKLMNRYAIQMGLKNTFFTNASGLPNPDHLTTAYDTLLLTYELITRFPNHYKIYSELEFTYNDIRQPNRNKLLTMEDYVDGVKTGHTDDAGYCLVASGVQNGMRLISVVMGADSDEDRNRETRKLFSYGFRNFELTTVVGPENKYDSLKVYEGAESDLDVRIREQVRALLPRGASTKPIFEIHLPSSLVAPISKGDNVGNLSVSYEGKVIATKELFASHDVPKMGFWTGIFEGIKGWFSTVPKDKKSDEPQSIVVETSIDPLPE